MSSLEQGEGEGERETYAICSPTRAIRFSRHQEMESYLESSAETIPAPSSSSPFSLCECRLN